MSPEKKKLAFQLLIHSILLIPLYFLLPVIGFAYPHYLYLGLAAALFLWYVIYNKGFVYRGLTPDQLSSELSKEEREALIKKMEHRFDSSRWVLTVLLPILLAFLFDFVDLFLFPALENLFA